jgi:hypothetical protein
LLYGIRCRAPAGYPACLPPFDVWLPLGI